MKIFLSTDMEGTAGVVDWSQCRGPGPEYEYYRGQLQAEVNAAIDGALAAGGTEFLVNDSHSTMQNLRPDELHGRASYLSGKHKPLYMMQGLDDSFDAAFFVSYHGSAGSTSSVLHHTYNPRAIAEVRLNGAITGEAGINALVALAYGVPVVLISGDRVTIDEAQAFCPDIESVVVKDSVSHNAALSVHPEQARELIHDGARRALARLSDIRLPSIPLPAELTVRFHNGAFAELACELRGVERREEKVVALHNDDPLQLYRTFIATVLLSRGVSE
ncbi:D-amino peptidase [Kribbella sp. VKM Ac-2571]|uniref:M55 family metallopeptidase n=1 Tax=Kribbella sp. VKM Ac-2571 TaxID=2512222 RepID=UPI0010604D63|nr:M55 family metallopeptidase [Kribbella sp. VKM Ac-2571]TDO56197.1 D-amino peptidase [Kribbella sp. VKM Ac-2571]